MAFFSYQKLANAVKIKAKNSFNLIHLIFKKYNVNTTMLIKLLSILIQFFLQENKFEIA